MAAKKPALSRGEEIRADIQALREKHILACPDRVADVIALLVEKDERAGKYEWPHGAAKKPKPTVSASPCVNQ